MKNKIIIDVIFMSITLLKVTKNIFTSITLDKYSKTPSFYNISKISFFFALKNKI